MSDMREIVPLEEGEDGEIQEADAPVRSGNIITYPNGKIADAKTGETIREPDGTLTPPAVNTERATIEPVKIGYWTDSHWGSYGTFGYVDSESALKAKIDEFAQDMNDWGADIVVWGGDITNEDTSSLSNSKQRITDFRNYAESQLNCPTHMVWGNHEYAQASSWGVDWSYSPWGISSTDETYYSIDTRHAKVIVLNTSYDETDTLKSSVPSGQFEWLKTQLETTNKPVLIFTHTPPQPDGTLNDYNTIGVPESGRYTNLFSQYDNIISVLYGHSHHEGDRNNASYVEPLTQSYQNTRYIYQHFPHRLGGNGDINNTGDTSITPYGKIEIRQDGDMTMNQSYLGQNTGYNETFEVSGTGSASSAHEQWLRTRESNRGAPLRTNEYITATSGTGAAVSTVQGDTSGNRRYLKLETSDSTGNWAQAVYKQLTPTMTDESNLDWPDMWFWAVAKFPFPSGTDAYLARGSVANATDPHIGFYADPDDGKIYGHTGDGSNSAKTNAALGDTPTSPTMLQCRYYADKQRVDFSLGHWQQKKIAIDWNIPPLDQTSGDLTAPEQLLNARVETIYNQNKELHLFDWETHLTPKINYHV